MRSSHPLRQLTLLECTCCGPQHLMKHGLLCCFCSTRRPERPGARHQQQPERMRHSVGGPEWGQTR
eukprot:scaffold58068_cov31-Tisochrysis_lutea.AAC.3